MTYHFYGHEDANKVHAINNQYKGIDTILDLYNALDTIWCKQTCAPRMQKYYESHHKTLGQCSITSFLVQDIFGGDVYGNVNNDGDLHCFNVIDGYVFDLTCEQFGEHVKDIDYSLNTLQDRETPQHFFKEEKRKRYEYLKQKLNIQQNQ